MASSFLTDIAVQKVLQYVNEQLFEPDSKWPIDILEQRSYARWAAYEIAQLILDNPFESPDYIVEQFRLQMLIFSHVFDESDGHNMFAIAEYVATDILQLL